MFQPFFLHGHRFPSVINARLRNKCSDPNDDLFHKHVSDHNIYTNCLVPEITEYYLFHCNKYALSLSLHLLWFFLDTYTYNLNIFLQLLKKNYKVILYQESEPCPSLRYLNHVLLVNVHGRVITKLQNLWFDPFTMYIYICMYVYTNVILVSNKLCLNYMFSICLTFYSHMRVYTACISMLEQGRQVDISLYFKVSAVVSLCT